MSDFVVPFTITAIIAALAAHLGSVVSVVLPESVIEKNSLVVDKKQSLKMPVLMCAVLILLFVLKEYTSKALFSFLMNCYFCAACIPTFATVISCLLPDSLVSACRLQDVCVTVDTSRNKKFSEMMYKLKLIKPITLELRRGDILSLLLAAVLPIAYLCVTGGDADKNVLLSTAFAVVLAITNIPTIAISKFPYGILLLFALLVYDVLSVFGLTIKSQSGQSVMESVARGITLPIKLIIPRHLSDILSPSGERARPVMLGLGDIVIPGAYLAMLKRMERTLTDRKGRPVKGLYYAGLLAYVCALGVTGAVLNLTKKGQPALLYISPALILTSLIYIATHGCLKEALDWQYLSGECKQACPCK